MEPFFRKLHIILHSQIVKYASFILQIIILSQLLFSLHGNFVPFWSNYAFHNIGWVCVIKITWKLTRKNFMLIFFEFLKFYWSVYNEWSHDINFLYALTFKIENILLLRNLNGSIAVNFLFLYLIPSMLSIEHVSHLCQVHYVTANIIIHYIIMKLIVFYIVSKNIL